MIKFYIFILLVNCIGSRADCDYGLVIREFEAIKLLSLPNGYAIHNNQVNKIIPSSRNVVLWCVGGFAMGYDYNHETTQLGKLITIYCDGYEMSFTSEFDLQQQTLIQQTGKFIACKEFSPNFYVGKVEYCDYQGLRHGVNVKDFPLVSLELCHDFSNSEPIFTHYVAAQRSSLLTNQIEYNPSNVTQTDLSSEALVNIEDEKPPAIELDNEHTLFIPSLKHILSVLAYNYSELAPNTLYSHLNINAFNHHFNIFNAAPWWTPLKEGNWKAYQKLLSRQVERQSFGIYVGKSHKAHFPKDFLCSSETEMTYDFDGRKKHIPLYIWNYVIPRNQEIDNDEFVLLGINSPFMETNKNNSLVICEDICDRISWLKPLEATRKMPSFGYVFCCKPEEVYTILDGFPVIKYKGVID